MDEEALTGGNTTPGVVRVGATVRRPRHDRSAFVARVLTSLHEGGFHWAPTSLGSDDEGREVFSHVEGTTTDHPSQRDEQSYAAIGRILRQLHELTRGTPLAVGGECIVHGDAAPFNTVMRDGMPVALIDWDGVHAGDSLEDVGYAAWTWCIQSVGAVPVEDQADRLRRFRDGYDEGLPAEVLLQAVEARQRWIATVEGEVRDRPTTSAPRRAHAEAAIAWAEDDRALLDRDRAVFLAALTR